LSRAFYLCFRRQRERFVEKAAIQPTKAAFSATTRLQTTLPELTIRPSALKRSLATQRAVKTLLLVIKRVAVIRTTSKTRPAVLARSFPTLPAISTRPLVLMRSVTTDVAATISH